MYMRFIAQFSFQSLILCFVLNYAQLIQLHIFNHLSIILHIWASSFQYGHHQPPLSFSPPHTVFICNKAVCVMHAPTESFTISNLQADLISLTATYIVQIRIKWVGLKTMTQTNISVEPVVQAKLKAFLS